jgi:iron complex transport system ATP-binding protein
VAQGTPQSVIQKSIIEKWYQADVRVEQHPQSEKPYLFLSE